MSLCGMKHLSFLVAITIILLTSCGKDRDPDKPTNTEHGPGWHTLYVNEIYANASGSEPDWVELYNPSGSAFHADSGKYFLTDKLDDLEKYSLPAFNIPANGFIQVICDNTAGVTAGLIHTNFSLKSTGEQVGLCFRDTILHVSDSLSFPETVAGTSYGRNPDGGSVWNSFNTPTPAASNQ